MCLYFVCLSFCPSICPQLNFNSDLMEALSESHVLREKTFWKSLNFCTLNCTLTRSYAVHTGYAKRLPHAQIVLQPQVSIWVNQHHSPKIVPILSTVCFSLCVSCKEFTLFTLPLLLLLFSCSVIFPSREVRWGLGYCLYPMLGGIPWGMEM